MSSIPIHFESKPQDVSLLRSAWDLPLIALGFLQGAILLLYPSPFLIALGMWWAANTIAHNFIHRPFFSSRPLNRLFSLYLTLIIGLPQSLWRQRHLAHHADRNWQLKITPQLTIEFLALLTLWLLLAKSFPKFFLSTYTPAYLAGLCLCETPSTWGMGERAG